jgi:hypothetical protein
MNTTVSILADLPEDLYAALTDFLESHSNWDHERIFSASLSLFLMQNGHGDRRTNRIYLESVFRAPAR